MFGLTLVSALFLLNSHASAADKFETVLQWKVLEYDYNDTQRQADISSGFYDPSVPMPIDVDVYYNGTSKIVLVTTPRFQKGTPATLTEYVGDNDDGIPILRPYPSWEWHRNVEECHEDRLINVFRIKIDTCARLWAVDDGKYADTVTCPAQLVAFDLATNQVAHRVTIPDTLAIRAVSDLVTPIVDIRDGKCDEAVVYIADTIRPGIIVYNMKTGVISKATHRTMYSNPCYGSFNILGYEFDLMDGILGMDLEPKVTNRERKLFYTSLAGASMNYVNTSVLQNQEAFIEDQTAERTSFKEYYMMRKSQTAAIAIDKSGIMYFGDVIKNSILCWNTGSYDYGMYIDTVYTNKTTMQFQSGMKVIDHPSRTQELWVSTSRLQRVFTDTLDVNDVNFRISVGKIPEILDGTTCSRPSTIPRNLYYHHC